MMDLLDHNLKIVFCGTAKGSVSAKTGSFYAHPSNRFYSVLHEAGLTKQRLEPDAFQTLLEYRIGLTDLNQTDSGMDRGLSAANFDIAGFEGKMRHYRPRWIAFTSLAAARAYFGKKPVRCGVQVETLGGAKIVVLPSTSAANGHWTKDRHHWYQLSEMI